MYVKETKGTKVNYFLFHVEIQSVRTHLEFQFGGMAYFKYPVKLGVFSEGQLLRQITPYIPKVLFVA